MHLLVAVDAAHPLFEAGGVPGDVPVEKSPGELHVEPFARRVGADHVEGAALRGYLAEELDLDLAFAEIHPAVDLGDLAGETEPFEPPDQVDEGVTMLGEDDSLLLAGHGVFEVFAELVELRLVALGVHLLRQVEERLDLRALHDQFREGDGHDAPERLAFGDLVLFLSPLGGFLVAGLVLEHVLGVVELALHRRQFIGGDPARLDRLDEPVELLQTTLEGPEKGIGRTGQAALEDRHGEPGRRAVEDAGSVVVVVDVLGRLLVEGLLADLALGEVVAEGVADAARVDALPLEADHLLLGPADEVATSRIGGVGVEGIDCREDLGLQQSPERVVREVLAHVGRGSKE